MSVQLHLHCRQQPDVVERILRVIRHRGFTLNAMSMAPSSCGEKIEVAVTVSSSRPLHLLTAQLQKLHDVLQLSNLDTMEATSGLIPSP